MSITPFITTDRVPGVLQDIAVDIYKADAALSACMPDSLRHSVTDLLRTVNSYYSNRIEGNPTRPADILRARQDADSAGTEDDDLLEIKIYAEIQAKLDLGAIDSASVCSKNFLLNIHKAFYTGLPAKFTLIEHPDTHEKISLVPGQLRQHTVRVGEHIPPGPDELDSLMNWFDSAYRPDRIHGIVRLFAAAASHHRLAWIHPFLDGNGRAGRLFTDNYMRHAGLDGYGLWSVCRGFARDKAAYYAALARADMVRQGSTDGRGILSDGGLAAFTRYFLETALDQVKFFSGLLEPEKFVKRVHIYFELRAKGALPGDGRQPMPILKPKAEEIYIMLLKRGPMTRTDIRALIDLGEHPTRNLLTQMAAEGLIEATPNKPIALSLSAASLPILFPKLW
ncbi:MAG: Fic family protein [Gammaproteobacteria bacterium]|nr:Fic family protein [Gammaproteobacteria bacterium]